MNKIDTSSQDNEMSKVFGMLVVVFIGSVLFWVSTLGGMVAFIYWLFSLL